MSENINLSRIDESKRKLAEAFGILENVFESKLSAISNNSESDDLKRKLKESEVSYKKIQKEYESILGKYNEMQNVSAEVADDLDISINFIEKILEEEDANS